jgi:hypothetical protein
MNKIIEWRRLRLRRSDGRVYLNRWGIRTRWGSILLHRMTAPDPGFDLHDHPWNFTAIILRGGYTEHRSDILTHMAYGDHRVVEHRPGSVNRITRSECHRIVALQHTTSWSLVFTGPRNGDTWGFYVQPSPDEMGGGYIGRVYINHTEYSDARRDMHADIQPRHRSDERGIR